MAQSITGGVLLTNKLELEAVYEALEKYHSDDYLKNKLAKELYYHLQGTIYNEIEFYWSLPK